MYRACFNHSLEQSIDLAFLDHKVELDVKLKMLFRAYIYDSVVHMFEL